MTDFDHFLQTVLYATGTAARETWRSHGQVPIMAVIELPNGAFDTQIVPPEAAHDRDMAHVWMTSVVPETVAKLGAIRYALVAEYWLHKVGLSGSGATQRYEAIVVQAFELGRHVIASAPIKRVGRGRKPRLGAFRILQDTAPSTTVQASLR